MYAALIIDADADAQFAIQNAFSDDPIDFRSVNSAQDGIEAAAGAKTDLILIRIELPTSSGFSVFSKLRRNPATKHIPVVLYASDVADDVFTRHASLRTHAEGYLRLPIQQSELHSLIRPLLSLPAPEPATPTHQLDVQLQDPNQSTPATASEWDTEISSEDVDSALDSLGEPDMVESIEFDVDPEDEQFEISLSSDDDFDDSELEISSEEVDLDFAPLHELNLPDQGQSSEPGVPQEPILLSQPASPNEPPAKPSRKNPPAASDERPPQEAATTTPTELSKPLQAPAKRQAPVATRKDASPSPSLSPKSGELSPARPSQDHPQPAAAKAPAAESFAPAASLSGSASSQSAIDLDHQPEKAPEPAANLHEAAQPKPQSSEAARPASGHASERRQLLAIKTQLLEKDRELLALREELERHERDSLEQRKTRREQQGQVAELQAAQLEYEESSIVAQERIETMESEITQFKADSERQAQALNAANEAKNALENELKAVKAELEQQKAEVQSERERAESRVKAQEQKNSESTALIASLEKQLQERDTKLQSRQEQIEDAQASLSGLLERLKAS